MIGFLQGNIKYNEDGIVIVDCNGVGYRVEMGDEALKLEKGREAEIFVHTHMRENELKLFGFTSGEKLRLFSLLIDISGIGPRGALQLISGKGVSRIVNAILQKDAAGLKVPGIGKKTADKIILELQDKLEDEGFRAGGVDGDELKDELAEKLAETKAALKSLGYTARQVESAISNIRETDGLEEKNTQDILKLVLKQIK